MYESGGSQGAAVQGFAGRAAYDAMNCAVRLYFAMCESQVVVLLTP